MKKLIVVLMIAMFSVGSANAFEWFWESPPPPALTAWEAQRYESPDPSMKARIAAPVGVYVVPTPPVQEKDIRFANPKVEGGSKD